MNFPIQRGAEVKNRSIITTPKSGDRHKKKTHIIVKSIHSSFRSESNKNIDLVENWFCVKNPVFPSFHIDSLKKY